MYSKDEASRLRSRFWTSFGLYLSPLPSASGEKINWVNYKTGVKHISFKMDATNRFAAIGIYCTHPAPEQQDRCFEMFVSLKAILQQHINEEWEWEQRVADDYGKNISRIYGKLDSVNIYNEADWPEIISFLKPRIMALDAFWNETKDVFELLD